jgi:phospholipase C
VPAIAISAWIPERTVVTSQYRHTSIIATLRSRWSLGDPLTARDTVAADIAPLLTLEAPRDPQDWPEVVARPVPPYSGVIPAPEAAVGGLCKSALHACVEFAAHRGKPTPQLSQDEDLSRADALALLDDLSGDAFVRLRGD